MSKLTIKVGKEAPVAKAEGFKLALPEKKVIPGSGYLVVAEEKAGSSVHVPPGAIDAAPKSHERTPAELIYNVIDDGDLPNLETFLANGGVIDVMSPHALVISEVMWGSDASIESMTILRVNGLSCIMRVLRIRLWQRTQRQMPMKPLIWSFTVQTKHPPR